MQRRLMEASLRLLDSAADSMCVLVSASGTRVWRVLAAATMHLHFVVCNGAAMHRSD